jgi:hypothetical protein
VPGGSPRRARSTRGGCSSAVRSLAPLAPKEAEPPAHEIEWRALPLEERLRGHHRRFIANLSTLSLTRDERGPPAVMQLERRPGDTLLLISGILHHWMGFDAGLGAALATGTLTIDSIVARFEHNDPQRTGEVVAAASPTGRSSSPSCDAPERVHAVERPGYPPRMQKRLLDGDLTVHDGLTHADDLAVNGWVTVLGGTLTVEGTLTCLGIEVASLASLACHELIANVVVVAADPPGHASGSRVRAAKVRALVVHVVKAAMANIIAYRDVDAVYLQHDGAERIADGDNSQGDLAYATGDLGVLRPEYYESVETDAPVKLDIAALRRTLCAGDNPFDRAPLVAWRAAPPVVAASPVLDDLTRWLSAHPGPQRALLDELPPWIARLAAEDAMTRNTARRRISRAISSPKLLARRDELLAQLEP